MEMGWTKGRLKKWKTATQDTKHGMRSKYAIRIWSDDGTLWMPHASPSRHRNK
jgi:hypothetical protein